ncbi:hypothetical protein M6B38_387605 [Iris pallida]|uniref:Uncharacterized protein n=1 Tax=Iris pallida TaxID=29817 RepID=A0AAX6G302_IRIPA|nr:hypothetical protein M6B38_387605 [Iris pallida]
MENPKKEEDQKIEAGLTRAATRGKEMTLSAEQRSLAGSSALIYGPESTLARRLLRRCCKVFSAWSCRDTMVRRHPWWYQGVDLSSVVPTLATNLNLVTPIGGDTLIYGCGAGYKDVAPRFSKGQHC